MRLPSRLTAAAIAAFPTLASAQSPTAPADSSAASPAAAAVARAALDYVDGFYEGDTAKLVRALRPDVAKYGYSRDAAGRYAGEPMSFAQALAYARRVRARGRPVDPAWPRAVHVYEAQDQTASAKVTAWWGTDYLLLAREDGRWVITHVLWQSAPPRAGR